MGGEIREKGKGVEGNLCQQGVCRRLVAEGRRKQRGERVNSGFVFMCDRERKKGESVGVLLV